LITFLRERCGIESRRMLLLQQRKAPPPHPLVVALALEQRLVPKRKGRRPYRLVVSPPGVRASRAPDRVLSMLGLHWRFLLLGAALEAQRNL
jgi:hypothetical protein